MTDTIMNNIPAHSDTLTTLSLMPGVKKNILTSSLDSFLKIWTMEGDLLASYNINNPLPFVWHL